MDDRRYTVYCHTNKINGKKYVGITSTKPEQRWRNGNGYKNNRFFYSAIQKYGWEEFTHEILFTNFTKKEAEQKERELIAKWQTNDREYGYNITSGGDGVRDYHHTEETKEKMSKSHIGMPFPEDERRKRANPIICVETGIIYYGLREAGKAVNVNSQSIFCCLKGVQKTAGGYHWEYCDTVA